ncbi:hypothetical protein GQ44DRAFT_733563 [Phaeosphaeriaceae sp. PMI808]|nr:hypothetical protein GQ44DRAFT_733563 [Phaeosphaeriaceae sp. PMI808]
MTDFDREEMGLVGTGTGNDVVPNAHSESHITAISQPSDRLSNNHDAHPAGRDHAAAAAARRFDYPTVYVDPSSDGLNRNYYRHFMNHEDDTSSTRASAARNGARGIEFDLMSPTRLPTASMAGFMTVLEGGNELAASVGSLQIGQHNGSVTASHTIVNGNSAPREDNQPTRLSDILQEEEDPATQEQWRRLWEFGPVHRQDTPLPTPTPPVSEDDYLGPRLPTEGLFLGDSSEDEAGSAAPASNQADLIAPAPPRNTRAAARRLARRGSLRREF